MMRNLKRALASAAMAAGLAACGGATGACVGTGGVLHSPVCKQDWSKNECDSFQTQGVNGATWTLQEGKQCQDLGYTERCSDGSYREPGAC